MSPNFSFPSIPFDKALLGCVRSIWLNYHNKREYMEFGEFEGSDYGFKLRIGIRFHHGVICS